jgi:hypothetical protein
MTAQLPITHDASSAFAYIGQFHKRPAVIRRGNISEETSLHLLAREIASLMPDFAEELVANGRKRLAMELA